MLDVPLEHLPQAVHLVLERRPVLLVVVRPQAGLPCVGLRRVRRTRWRTRWILSPAAAGARAAVCVVRRRCRCLGHGRTRVVPVIMGAVGAWLGRRRVRAGRCGGRLGGHSTRSSGLVARCTPPGSGPIALYPLCSGP